MLRFIYTKEVRFMGKKAFESSLKLFNAAHIYQIHELKKVCKEYVHKLIENNKTTLLKMVEEIQRTNKQLLEDTFAVLVRIVIIYI